MSEEQTVTFNLEVNVEEAKTNIAELNRLLTTYVALARRAGLPENILDAIAQIQQFRVAVQTLHRSIMLLYTTTGPIGWLIGLGGLALGGLMLADQMEMRRPKY